MLHHFRTLALLHGLNNSVIPYYRIRQFQDSFRIMFSGFDSSCTSLSPT